MNKWHYDRDYYLVNEDGKIVGRAVRIGFSDRFNAYVGGSGCIGEYINCDAAKAAVEKALAEPTE